MSLLTVSAKFEKQSIELESQLKHARSESFKPKRCLDRATKHSKAQFKLHEQHFTKKDI